MSVRFVRGPLSVPAAMRALHAAPLGGVVLFAGRVRPDRGRNGRVVALDYETHATIARRELSRLERVARRRFGAERIVLWHRLGRVRVGEVSVIVGTACAHRTAAFDAARFLIEELKTRVPIWKTERARPARRPPRRRSRRGARSAG